MLAVVAGERHHANHAARSMRRLDRPRRLNACDRFGAGERAKTKGGEALAMDQATASWFALWTHSHCEQLVHDQLAVKGFRVFVPTMRTWSRRAGKRRSILVPMFQGYLFINHAIDQRSYIEIRKTRGLVRILGARWDELLQVADAEIEALRRIQDADVPVLPHAYLREGQRVRINEGPLTGVEGILVRSRPNRGVLVLSVDMLRQSVAVEVDCTAVVPVGEPLPVPDPHLKDIFEERVIDAASAARLA